MEWFSNSSCQREHRPKGVSQSSLTHFRFRSWNSKGFTKFVDKMPCNSSWRMNRCIILGTVLPCTILCKCFNWTWTQHLEPFGGRGSTQSNVIPKDVCWQGFDLTATVDYNYINQDGRQKRYNSNDPFISTILHTRIKTNANLQECRGYKTLFKHNNAELGSCLFFALKTSLLSLLPILVRFP